jgi:hypothetical protein
MRDKTNSVGLFDLEARFLKKDRCLCSKYIQTGRNLFGKIKEPVFD